MAGILDAATTDGTTVETDVHYQTVSQRVPKWLVDSTTQQRQALRSSVPQPMPWLADAAVRLPEVVQALRDEQQRHGFYQRTVTGYLAQLPSAEDFAEPLLREALKATFGLDLDLRKTFLFNAARARVDESLITTGDPLVRAFQVVKAATQPLLLAALQNFEAFEAEEGGMRDGRRPSSIFASDTGLPMDPERDIDVSPERFAGLCRQLDLGGQYQRLIDSVFQPAPEEGESAQVAIMNREAWFKLFEQSTFRLNLHLARLRGWVDWDLYDRLLEVAKNGKAELESCALKLWDVELNGVVLFSFPAQGNGVVQRLVVYMPDEPGQPFRQFDSSRAFHDWLRERLGNKAWSRYFLRFVPARERDRLVARIHRTLHPQVWNAGGWFEERFDPNATLRLTTQAISAPLFNMLLQRKLAVFRDDGLFHAVPTATQDHKSIEDKVGYFLAVGFNVLNVAAFVVPGLGEVMLAVNAAMLGYEVYEGFDSLAKGEREEAWGYFMDVGENLAIMAALGAAGAVARRFSGNLPLAVRSMRPVTLEDGTVRLWKPDMAPFAYDIELPAGLEPGENGLYDWRGRQWLKLDGRYYSVRTLTGAEQGYRIEHPSRVGAYAPSLRPNGNGGWLHEADTPAQWRGLELFRRQGYREANVSADMAQRAMRISGISESQLRQTLVDSRRPPALLTDTLRRLMLAQSLGASGALDVAAFAEGYQALQPRLSLQGQVLQRQFALPNGLIEELVGAATPQEASEMAGEGRVPLRLADEARIYQQQVRIARACEGLFLDLPASADTARLFLHGLEGLSGWPQTLHMALYEGSIDGRLLARIGPEQEPAVAVIWRGQRPQGFCETLLADIPGIVRDKLGIRDAASLREKLQERAVPSQRRIRQWLGMQPVKPGFRSPTRLADGRLGHPLSGRGQAFFTEDELLDKLRLLELEEVYPEDALRALYDSKLDRVAINARLNRLLDEMLELRQSLDRWALDSAREVMSETRQVSRERIGLALWEYWRRSILPELGQPASRLILWQVQLSDLPTQLPPFLTERVRTVLLNEVTQGEGADYQRIIGENQLQAFARLFPDLNSLDICRGAWGIGLPQIVARTWPRLTALGLRESGTIIGLQDFRALAGLPRLRWLNLRGVQLLDMPSSALEGLTLDYLGLDWLDLKEWPQWLDTAALARIGQLSLAGNQLSEVPTAILHDATRVARPMRVSLHGNRLSRPALLDMRLAERFLRRFTFDLGLPEAVEGELRGHVEERRELHTMLQAWTDPASTSAPLPAEQVTYRQRISQAYLEYWRDSLHSSGSALLRLEDVKLHDMPGELPGFFLLRVRRLELSRFEGSHEHLRLFLQRFPHLVEMNLTEARPVLGSVPEFFSSFTQLRELALIRMGLVIDQAAMGIFGRMSQLSSLQLDGNRLGEISDVRTFNRRILYFLGLSNMQIATWPVWLDVMLPCGIERLALDDNRLTELPARLLDNRRTPDASVEISLRNNPLSRDTMVQAHISQDYNRPYTFVMDLPADIAAMAAESHFSDSQSEGSPEPETDESTGDFSSTWASGEAELDEYYQKLWNRLAARGDSQSLLRLVALLRHSADYRSTNLRPELIRRVRTVLVAAEQDSELCLVLNGMAEEPLRQLNSHETCPDGVRLEFNQMEMKVYMRQALSEITEQERGPALFRLMRSLFRSEILDQIAREQAKGRDQAEVRLAYRLRWADELRLPLPPRSMLYRASAELAEGELDRAMGQLQREEAGQGLLTFAAGCDFWVAYLRETFAERFKALREPFEAAVLEAVDSHPDEAPEQSSARIGVLEDRFKRDELALLERLTLEQSLNLA